MAGEDEKGKGKAHAAAEGPAKLDRRDVLMGLSTVPVLGLFGYAWNTQRQSQQARAYAPPVAPADLQEAGLDVVEPRAADLPDQQADSGDRHGRADRDPLRA